ncbi:MAG: hypothetical protein Q9207_003419 [Kuettlingeria erythrocarpa]
MATQITGTIQDLGQMVGPPAGAQSAAIKQIIDSRIMDLSKRMEAMLDELRPLKTYLEADFEHEKKERLAAITARDNTLANERQRLRDLERQLNARQEAIDKTERLRGSLDIQQGLLDSVNTNLNRRQELADEADAQLKSAQQPHANLLKEHEAQVRTLKTQRQASDKTRADLKEEAETLERAEREREVGVEALNEELAKLQTQRDAVNAREERVAAREAAYTGKEQELRRIQREIQSQITTFTPTRERAVTTIHEKGSATTDKVLKDLQGQVQETQKKMDEDLELQKA